MKFQTTQTMINGSFLIQNATPDFNWLTDESVANGGTGVTANTMQYFTAALGDSLLSYAKIEADKHGVRIAHLSVTVTTDMTIDPDAIPHAGANHIDAITYVVDFKSDLADEDAISFIKQVQTLCPIAMALGIPVHFEFR